jgi:nucleotide-binding universal stress UspA family protein
MFKQLLVTLDGTPESAVALSPARSLATASGGEITLLRVIPSDESVADDTPQMAQEYLDRIARELAGAGARVDTMVRRGDVATSIEAAAAFLDADLIVMATHGRGGLGRVILGSVASRVLSQSPVPVMLVRPGGRRMTHLKRLLVPVDGTPGGSVALGVAVELAGMAKADIVLLDVVVPIPAYVYTDPSGIGMYPGFPDPEWTDEAQASAKHYVDNLAARLQRAGIPAQGRTDTGDVAELIGRHADEVEADLIVMSTHALTGPARAILGSVADAVVRTAHQPVLLVRREYQASVPIAEEECDEGDLELNGVFGI